MRIEQLDHRPNADNEAAFADGPVLGIEITVPALAARCVSGNLDHHGEGATAETPSAAEQALDYVGQGPAPSTYAFLRLDLDTLAALAVFKIRIQNDEASGEVLGGNRTALREIIGEIGRYDRLGPAATDSWSPSLLALQDVLDEKCSAADKVATAARLILESATSWPYDCEEITVRAARFLSKLDRLRQHCIVASRGAVALVTVTTQEQFNPAQLGYEKADVVVVVNPAAPVDFADPTKGTHRKYTVCRRDSNVPANMEAILRELSANEPGWGGRADIIGSPQGLDSRFAPDEVVAIVARHVPTDDPADFDDFKGAIEGGGMAFLPEPPDTRDQPETPVFYTFGMRRGATWRRTRVSSAFVERAMRYLTQDGGWCISNHTTQTHILGNAVPPDGASWNQKGVGVVRGEGWADLFWRVGAVDGRAVDRYRPGARSVQEREVLFGMLQVNPHGLRYVRRGESRTRHHGYFTVHVGSVNVTALATTALADPAGRAPRESRGGYSGSGEKGGLVMVWIDEDGEMAALKAVTDSLGAALGPGVGPWKFAVGLATDPSGVDGEIPFTVE